MIVNFFVDFGFIVELLIAIGILTYSLKRRNHFLLKLLIVVTLLFSFVFLWDLVVVNVFTVIIKYIVLYFIAMYGILFVFESGIWSAIFFGTAGLTVQHLAYKIGYLIRSYMNIQSEELIGIVFYILVVVVVYLIAFIYISDKLKDGEMFHLKGNNKEIILITSTLILFTTVFQNIFEYLIDRDDLTLLLAITSYDIVSSILILAIMFGILRSSKLQHETKVLEHVLNSQQEHLKNSKRNMF